MPAASELVTIERGLWRERVDRIAVRPPLPVKMTKATVSRLAGARDDLASHMDHDQFVLATTSKDHWEGVAAFLDGCTPRLRGR
jgi:hypothetical protein